MNPLPVVMCILVGWAVAAERYIEQSLRLKVYIYDDDMKGELGRIGMSRRFGVQIGLPVWTARSNTRKVIGCWGGERYMIFLIVNVES